MVIQFLKDVGKTLRSDVRGGLDLLSAGFSHPLLTFQDPLAAVERTRREGAVKTISRTVRTTALGVGALLLPTRAGISFVGKQVVQRPLLVTSGLVVGGAAAVSPRVRKGLDIATDPSTLITGGTIVGEAIEGKAPDITVTEAALVGGLVGAGGIVAAKVIKEIKKRKEVPVVIIPKAIESQLEPKQLEEAVPTPIGAKTVVPKDKPMKEVQPINIEVSPEINVRPRKSEIFINNIIQSI